MRNIAANFMGQATVALLAFACVPVYVKYLGPEGYGLIGLYTALYTVLGIFDTTIQAFIGRDVARSKANVDWLGFVRRLRTLEGVLACLGLCLAAATAICAHPLAAGFKLSSLSVDAVSDSLLLMSGALALRLLEGLYRGCLMGLEKQVAFNTVFIVTQSSRWLGAVAILSLVSPSIELFFLWQLLVSGFTVAALAALVYASVGVTLRVLPHFASLYSERRFIGGMLVISAGAVLLTQTDKLLLSRLLPMAEFGDYALATVAAGALMLFVAPIADALSPRLVRFWTSGSASSYAEVFHLGAQLVTVVVGSVAITAILFAHWILEIWLHDPELVLRVTPLFQILIFGNLLNAFMWMPYRAQLASGWTGLAARINLAAVVLLVPLILIFVPRYGVLAAAWLWVILNAAYLAFGVHFMFRRLLLTERSRWYVQDIGLPAMVIICFSILFRMLVGEAEGAALRLAIIMSATIMVMFISMLVASQLREKFLSLTRSTRP